MLLLSHTHARDKCHVWSWQVKRDISIRLLFFPSRQRNSAKNGHIRHQRRLNLWICSNLWPYTIKTLLHRWRDYPHTFRADHILYQICIAAETLQLIPNLAGVTKDKVILLASCFMPSIMQLNNGPYCISDQAKTVFQSSVLLHHTM